MQYRPGHAYALNDVSFETRAAEKIGIVGRTGSGKSSLFLAIFQMVELKKGEILIDGINVASVDLDILRWVPDSLIFLISLLFCIHKPN